MKGINEVMLVKKTKDPDYISKVKKYMEFYSMKYIRNINGYHGMDTREVNLRKASGTNFFGFSFPEELFIVLETVSRF